MVRTEGETRRFSPPAWPYIVDGDTFQARRLGFSFGWIPAFAREQSSATLKDLMNQRRRWAAGLTSLDDIMIKFAAWMWCFNSFKPIV